MGEQVPQFPARARANTGHRKAADKPRGAHTHPHARARTHACACRVQPRGAARCSLQFLCLCLLSNSHPHVLPFLTFLPLWDLSSFSPEYALSDRWSAPSGAPAEGHQTPPWGRCVLPSQAAAPASMFPVNRPRKGAVLVMFTVPFGPLGAGSGRSLSQRQGLDRPGWSLESS